MYSRLLTYDHPTAPTEIRMLRSDNSVCCSGSNPAGWCADCREAAKRILFPRAAATPLVATTPSVPRAAATDLPDPAPSLATVLREQGQTTAPTVAVEPPTTIAGMLADLVKKGLR